MNSAAPYEKFRPALVQKRQEESQEQKRIQAFRETILNDQYFWEGIGPDGIQYPSGVQYHGGVIADRMKNRREHDDLLTAQLQELVLDYYFGNKSAADKLGKFLCEQCIAYIEKQADA